MSCRLNAVRALLWVLCAIQGVSGGCLALSAEPARSNSDETMNAESDHATAPPPNTPRPKPVVIAHRGASGYLPEHTLAAKALAFGQGADYLEQDTVLSKDGQAIVLHDIHLDTVTNVREVFPMRARADGRYYAIDFTLQELRQLSVHERRNLRTGEPVFPGRFPAQGGHFAIHTLEEELTFIAGLRHSSGRAVGIYVEIKEPRWHLEQGQDLGAAVRTVLTRHGYTGRNDLCFVQCFEEQELRRWRTEFNSPLRLIQLLEGPGKPGTPSGHDALCTPEGLQRVAEYANGIGPPLDRVILRDAGQTSIAPLVQQAQAAGLLVHPYTLRKDALPDGISWEELHRLLFQTAQVDGAFTDFPDLTLMFLRQPAGK